MNICNQIGICVYVYVYVCIHIFKYIYLIVRREMENLSEINEYI
jgi:hypothetical protein